MKRRWAEVDTLNLVLSAVATCAVQNAVQSFTAAWYMLRSPDRRTAAENAIVSSRAAASDMAPYRNRLRLLRDSGHLRLLVYAV